MGIVADRLDGLQVVKSSADGQLTGVLRPPGGLAVEFRPGAYPGYTERGLEHQLSELIGRLWNGYRQARLAAVAEATGQPAEPYVPWDADSRRFAEERDDTAFEGMSDGRVVFVSCLGQSGWRFVVRDGALSNLDEAEFAAEVASGYAALGRDRSRKLNQLRSKHFPR